MQDLKDDQLRHCRLLRRLRPDRLRAVSRTAELIDAPAGAVLEARNDHRACWWVVLQGWVVLDGPECSSLAGPGDFWGASECLAGRPPAATAKCFEDARCLVVDARRIRPLLLDVPELAIALLAR